MEDPQDMIRKNIEPLYNRRLSGAEVADLVHNLVTFSKTLFEISKELNRDHE